MVAVALLMNSLRVYLEQIDGRGWGGALSGARGLLLSLCSEEIIAGLFSAQIEPQVSMGN